MPQRIDVPRLLIGAGAAALLVSLFLDWYQPGFSAWTVFEIVDLILAAISLAALIGVIALALPRLGLPPPPASAHPTLAAVALALVLVTLVNEPPAAAGRGLESGIWVALGGALALAIGAVLAVARVSLAITMRPREQEPGADPDAAAGPGRETEPFDVEADHETRTLPRRGDG